MEVEAIFEEKVALSPLDLRANITSFDDILLSKLKKGLEGRCSRHGYVIPNSLNILSRSMGIAEKGRFTADILYVVKAQGKVYCPHDGTQVEGEVSQKNKMGIYVVLHDAIRIMIPRDLHIGNEEFDQLNIGDRIQIEIKKSRFQVNDPHILSIGQFLGLVNSGSSSAAAALAGAAPIPPPPAPEPASALNEEGSEENEEEEESSDEDE
jgi:DNA-directed RNA polymerase subunit E'/Rpb7